MWSRSDAAHPARPTRRRPNDLSALFLATAILLLAAGLRLYRLGDLPPGWRDDEVVETAVHAQLVLDGRFPLFFPQAEGHEPLYHYASAGLIALAGRSLFTVRLLSVFFGLFSIAAVFRFGRAHFGALAGLVAAAALGVSFWSLMYSRFKVRHISEVGLMVLAFHLVLQLGREDSGRPPQRALVWGMLAGAAMALCLHTYFAARTVPLIILAFGIYLAVFHRSQWRASWPGFAAAFATAGLLSAPLAWSIASTPGGESRLSVVGRPLQELLAGDGSYALRNTLETLGMIAFGGDPEFLYNIPGRPVFEWVGAGLFLAGALLCLRRWRRPACALLLIWLLGGLAPAFVSIPSASLGHTIAAQPAVYLMPALSLSALWRRAASSSSAGARLAAGLALTLFLGITAARDLRDYFVRWPALPEVRYLYRADLHEAAAWLKAQAGSRAPDIALASRSLHQADATALRLEAPALDPQPRLFDPARALVLPAGEAPLIVLRESASGALAGWPEGWAGRSFAILEASAASASPETPLAAAFANGWTFRGFSLTQAESGDSLRLLTHWQVEASFVPPPPRRIEILSGSPLTLKIFSHLLGPDGALISGDDRLEVDPATLHPGDRFIQLLEIPLPPDPPPGDYVIQIGLYDPESGARVRRLAGQADHLILTTLTLPP